jgi:hypothetical protein
MLHFGATLVQLCSLWCHCAHFGATVVVVVTVRHCAATVLPFDHCDYSVVHFEHCSFVVTVGQL